ncbi:hypothetical protein WR25_09657 [Diploscapter pachys]|uniref:UEV domain-containing protein n=1 Tax=Diploscapter pachys TaxID=2018661 RepID=A0A2A2J5F5_9BILA|nr:hypothetical protein WR25_09657 [Diploscapter pachys]
MMNRLRRSLSRERKANRDNDNSRKQSVRKNSGPSQLEKLRHQSRSISVAAFPNAMSSQTVLQHLKTAGAKYADSAKEDILAALQQFKDLAPSTENFLFPDGKRKMSFRLSGTIPVPYKGNTYNIPVCVYLYDTHPYYAPVCYVRPTNSMVIKESEHVNKEGRVFLPYLNEWRFPGYDLNGLLQMMAMIFQEKCPVFAKSTGSSGQNSGTATPTNSAVPATQNTAANNPPYPTTTPYPSSNPYTAPSANATPYPINTPFPTPVSGQNNPAYPPYANLPYPAYSMMNNSAASNLPVGSASSSTPSYAQSDAIRQSLISAVEAKLRNKLQEKLGTNYAELASIRQTQVDLRSGSQKLKTIADELEKQQKHLEIFVCQYQDKKAELEKALADSQVDTSKGLAIDQVIDAAMPLYRQLLENYAADLACDDVIYSLGQALKKGSLTVPEYLKRVRDISRQQFIHRATMQKCRRTAGLTV